MTLPAATANLKKCTGASVKVAQDGKGLVMRTQTNVLSTARWETAGQLGVERGLLIRQGFPHSQGAHRGVEPGQVQVQGHCWHLQGLFFPPLFFEESNAKKESAMRKFRCEGSPAP